MKAHLCVLSLGSAVLLLAALPALCQPGARSDGFPKELLGTREGCLADGDGSRQGGIRLEIWEGTSGPGVTTRPGPGILAKAVLRENTLCGSKVASFFQKLSRSARPFGKEFFCALRGPTRAGQRLNE